MRRLRAPGRVAAQLFGIQRLAGGLDAARLQGQEAQQGGKHGGLTGSGGAGHRGPGALASRQVQVCEDRVVHAGPAGGTVLHGQGGGRAGDLHAELLRGAASDYLGLAGLGRARRFSLGIGLGISRRVGAREAAGTLAVRLQQLLHLGLGTGTQTLGTTRQNVGVHLGFGGHGTLQGRGGDNALQGYVANARGNRGEQAGELGPGANRLDMAQGALQHAGAQQHHDR